MFQTIHVLVSWVGLMFTWGTWDLGMTLFWPLTQFDLILTFTCTLTVISFWPTLIEPYFYFIQGLTSFWAITFDLILTYSSLTSFWRKFDFISMYKSLTSFWPTIIWLFWFIKFDLVLTCNAWPHFTCEVWPHLTCNGVTWFWPAIVWPDFDLKCLS